MAIELCRSTAAERRRVLPGDDLMPSPRASVTHAITIEAPADAVWPWLVQIGAGRAGWYAYDRIDNGGVPSATRLLPEHQHLSAGDVVPALPGATDAFIVDSVIPGKALVLTVPVSPGPAGENAPLRATFALILEAEGPARTRLISRGRVSSDWLSASPGEARPRQGSTLIERVYRLLSLTPWRLTLPIAMTGHYIMESRMLRGIKRRAEQEWARARRQEQPGTWVLARRPRSRTRELSFLCMWGHLPPGEIALRPSLPLRPSRHAQADRACEGRNAGEASDAKSH